MGTFSIWHWLIVLVVVLVLFGGRGKIPSLMGDIAKGIKSFKTNMKDEDKAEADTQKIEETKPDSVVTSARKDETASS
ncbi:MAG: twin-arginine translocase TatA/TatE family subunit [Alphaproteobacteria bacterium]|jgi:sec-independent protein translocase protein TatA